MTDYTIRRVIQHNTTKSLINGVVRWLKTEPSSNDAEWQAHTDLVQACLEKMVEMSESTANANPSKVADKLNRAIPHVRSMLIGMWEHDRPRALAHGETTLRGISPRPSGTSHFSVTQNHRYGSILRTREVCRQ